MLAFLTVTPVAELNWAVKTFSGVVSILVRGRINWAQQLFFIRRQIMLIVVKQIE